jgi:hypothetical protein
MVGSPYQRVCPASFLTGLKERGLLTNVEKLVEGSGLRVEIFIELSFYQLSSFSLKQNFIFHPSSFIFHLLIIYLEKHFRMRTISLLLVGLFVSTAVLAQPYEGKVEYDKKRQDAFLCDYAASAEAVDLAIVKYFQELGYKPVEEKGLFNKDKGFKTFKDAFVKDLTGEKQDYLVKVESRSKKSTEGATLTLVIMKGLVNQKTDMKEDEIRKVKRFMSSLEASVQREYLELQIKAQEDQVIKTQKKLTTLKSEQIDLEKKLQTNLSNQQDTEKEISAKQTALEVLKAKRSN